MSSPVDMKSDNPLPKISRLITAHDASSRKAIFSTELPEEANFFTPKHEPPLPVGFYLAYATSSFPARLTDSRDLADYKAIFEKSDSSGLVKHGGILMRYVDYPPNCITPMHRTISLDFGIVIEGELECVLDSGERRTMKRGDVAVQRGTMHQWVNNRDDWARMVYVLIDATPVLSMGKLLGEDLTDLSGIPSSH